MDEFEKIKREALKAVDSQAAKPQPKKNPAAKKEPALQPPPPPQEQQKKCVQCAMMIPDEAKICPFCREKQPPPSLLATGFSWKRVGVGVGTFSVCALMLSFCINYLTDRPSKRTYEPTQGEAFGVCENYVKQRLKAPATADFASILDSSVTKTDSDTFTIRSYVDAENSFGAKLRNRYYCKVQHMSGDRWRLLDLQLIN